jgi:dipeptide/tripeptide permease
MNTWKFPLAFWTANAVELFERAAYYAMFIALTLYLTNVVGFGDVSAALIAGLFSGGLYLLPSFSGAVADSMGFRRAIIFAFLTLSLGYAGLGLFPVKGVVLPSLLLIMIGGSFVKPVISGTVAKVTNADTRARAYSIFYTIVNVGAFSGKLVAYPLRVSLGLQAVNLFAAAMALIALVVAAVFYRGVERTGEAKKLADVWRALLGVLRKPRLVILIFIVAGFWITQQQLYATMPKYVLRVVGNDASPEWIANVNPLVVVACVVLVTNLMKQVSALSSMLVDMLLMPFSAVCMAAGHWFGPGLVALPAGMAVHPVTLMLVAGIVIQGLAECFISPRYLEFFSLQAPKGEEGTYLGFGYLYSFVSSILGFGISGYLLSRYCPDPRTLSPEQIPAAYADAHVLWYYFAAIGCLSAVALAVYGVVVRRLDMRHSGGNS